MPFSRGALFHLLKNRLYLGEIPHRGNWHPGGHEGIVDVTTFDAVQRQLNDQRRRPAQGERRTACADLTGRIFDAGGAAMSPTHAQGKSGKLYRYYVSAPLQQGESAKTPASYPRRVSALALERALHATLARLLPDESSALEQVRRIEVHPSRLILTLPRPWAEVIRYQLEPGETVSRNPASRNSCLVTLPLTISTTTGRTALTAGARRTIRRDPALISALKRAHGMFARDEHGPRLEAAPPSQYARRVASLALLAPDIQRDILEGHQPPTLNLEALLAIELPPCWNQQRVALGWGDSTASPHAHRG